MISVCMNVSAQNLIYLNCSGNLTSKYKSEDFKNTTNTSTNGSVAIDATDGRVLEGTIAQGIIKIPSFTSTATDTRFRGEINPNNITEKQRKDLNQTHFFWYYSFDRYNGNYTVRHWYKAPPMKNGSVTWDEWDLEEKGTCTEITQRKF